jgi:hypothetical protein
MADYYSLLAKAVSNLPKAGPEPARKAIYDRARKALVRQLRSLGPALSEADIAREEAALEAAIGKLEGQFSPAAPTPPSPGGARPSPSPGSAAPRPSSYMPPPRPAPSAAAPPPGVRIPIPDTPLARPVPPPRSAPPPPSPERPSLSGAPPRPSNPPSSAAPRALPAAPMGLRPPPAARYSPPLAARRSEPRYEADSSPLGPPAADDFVDDGFAPPVEANKLDRAEAVGAADVGLRPSAPRRLDRPRRGATAWILAALVVGVVLSIAVFAFLWRQNPQDLAMKEPVATPTAEATAGPAKIVERVGGATATPTATPTAAETPPATETPAVVATPAATPSAATSPAATPAPTPAATAAPPAANSGVAVAARAAMLVAVAADPQKPAVSLGSVVWSAIPAAAGQPSTAAVKAEADIPDLKMHAVMTLRKNTDPSLPASHTIDLRVTFADGAEIKGIKDMRVPMMRRDDPPSQDALSGVRVKISDSYFLVGLNRGDAELAHNVDLIANRGWFDFPMLLNDDRIAKLTFEKGAEGERIVNDALAAWK